MPAGRFRDGAGQRTAVVFHGAAFALGSVFFNLIWCHARHARLLAGTTGEHAEQALTRRFGLSVPLYLALGQPSAEADDPAKPGEHTT